ncbi:MAG: imidazole glycerol phosphate synthase subunit HisH [Desulfobacterales bacterium]|nr:imidazole glycerol phosphate synthase subunit HisH [Desulfobacterales bacterium]
MIAIIDYGLGNLLSVSKAFETVAGPGEVLITRNPSDLASASHIVLPGAGNFKTGIKNLENLKLKDALDVEVLSNGKAFLGICLGMQLCVEYSEEFGINRGLGWIPGHVRKLQAGGFLLPHIGWNNFEIQRDVSLLPDYMKTREFYFVHSYCLECPDEFVVAYCDYGEKFPAIIQKDNILAVQFHPEKSREQGLEILKYFVKGETCSNIEWFLSSS